MSKKAKLFFGITAANLKGMAGAGGGPNVMDAFMNELKGIEIEFVLLEEGRPIAQQVTDVEIIIPAVSEISKEVINAAANLKGIIQPGIGLDTVDIPAATERNIPVANVPEGSDIPMGEYAFVLMLCTLRRVMESIELMKKGIFFLPTTTELAGKTLGLIGLGRSARELLKRAKAFDMEIIGVDKYPDQVGNLGIDFVGSVDKLDYVLENSDIVSLHCPANEETKGMINYEKICRMKNTAILINLARASIIDREGFIRAMKENKIKGAGLDVFWDEPMNPEDEILKLPNVFCTPHIATSTVEARLRIFSAAARSIRKVLEGQKPDNCVNL